MPKNTRKNGFFNFLIETQTNLKCESKFYSLKDDRLLKIAGDRWKELNEIQKSRYKKKNVMEVKKSSNTKTEVSLKNYTERVIEKNADTKDHEKNSLDEDSKAIEKSYNMIETYVCAIKDKLKSNFFYVIGTNVMLETSDKLFPPLEISIAKYSINEGIKYTYHRFIDPGEIPIGYARTAHDFAKEFHKIPLTNFTEATNNYNKIVEEIIELLQSSRFNEEPSNKIKPNMVFCQEKNIEQTKGVLEWLAVKYRLVVPKFFWNVEVLDLVTLLYYISLEKEMPIVEAIGEGRLSSSIYDYSPNTNCQFHDKQENKNCAQGLVKRLCYLLSDSCCPIFNVNPTVNHFPQKLNSINDIYYQKLHFNPKDPSQPIPSMSELKRNLKSICSSSKYQRNSLTTLGIGRGNRSSFTK